jgi:hypothetical protein
VDKKAKEKQTTDRPKWMDIARLATQAQSEFFAKSHKELWDCSTDKNECRNLCLKTQNAEEKRIFAEGNEGKEEKAEEEFNHR